jgi:hypothetical protein
MLDPEIAAPEERHILSPIKWAKTIKESFVTTNVSCLTTLKTDSSSLQFPPTILFFTFEAEPASGIEQACFPAFCFVPPVFCFFNLWNRG